MKYLIIDACMGGTGIRDKNCGGYIEPIDLGLSSCIIEAIQSWLKEYEAEHYNGYNNTSSVKKLDEKGKKIAVAIKDELLSMGVKVEYYSDAKMIREIIA